MKQHWLLLSAVLLSGACASSTSPVRTAPEPTSTRPLPPIAAQVRVDADEFRQALDEAYATILTRNDANRKLPIVDADATRQLTIPDHRTVRSALNYFSTGLHDSIQTSLYRSAAYKPMIDPVLRQYGVPPGFAYLPVIESAYLPTLTSRAGAHGLWQFMPDTAREYGLRVDWWVDERADPEKSTRAAAAFLRDLYKRFGDWSLALAAYNCGPGRVQRALRETGSTTFWELLEAKALPKETRGYVPTFWATLLIASDPDTYGFQLRNPSPAEYKRVELPGPLSLQFIASTADIDASLLKEMNPQFVRGIVPPGKSSLRVPPAAASVLASAGPSLREQDPHVAVASYTLRDGDSLTSLAKAIGTSPDEIAKMNGVRRDRIAPGVAIYLPVQQHELSRRLRAERAPAGTFHVVAAGETLYSIARANGLTVEELLDLNRLGSDAVIHPGDRLRVSLGSSLTSGM